MDKAKTPRGSNEGAEAPSFGIVSPGFAGRAGCLRSKLSLRDFLAMHVMTAKRSARWHNVHKEIVQNSGKWLRHFPETF
jgi:hypothetical protein